MNTDELLDLPENSPCSEEQVCCNRENAQYYPMVAHIWSVLQRLGNYGEILQSSYVINQSQGRCRLQCSLRGALLYCISTTEMQH